MVTVCDQCGHVLHCDSEEDARLAMREHWDLAHMGTWCSICTPLSIGITLPQAKRHDHKECIEESIEWEAEVLGLRD